MSECVGCGASIDCPSDEIFPYSLTPGSPFPYVVNCPEGVDCSDALSITMTCCGTPTTLNIPAGTPANERLAMIQQLIAQCAFINQGCDSNQPTNPNDPSPPTTTFYFNQRQVGQSVCSTNYGGGTFYFPIAAGSYIGTSQAAANSQAAAAASSRARSSRFCLNAPCLCPCADVAATINIKTVRGIAPFSYEITSGSLPSGMTLAFVGGVLRLAGTATTSGAYAITLKVFDQSGGWLIKNLTINVLKISTTSPLPTPSIGVPYSKQLVGEGGTGDYAFAIISGALPGGLTMSSAGLITGIPTATTGTITVRMRDHGLSQTSGGCEKEFTFGVPASFIIYYSAANSAPWFDPGAPLGSIMAFDLSTIPGNNDLIEGSTGGVPKIVAGKLSVAWQGGFIDPNPGGSTFPSGDCSGYWNYFPRVAAGLTNKFTMRFWFRIDPYIAEQLAYSSIYFDMIELESGFVSVELDEPPNVFRVRARFVTNLGAVAVTSADITLDANWHRVVVMYDPDTDVASLQIDNDTPTTQVIPDVEPTDGRNAIKWAPQDAGVFEPDNDSRLTLAQWCEFYIASDYIWTTEQSTSDWNSGNGRTWPEVPGV